MFSCTFTAPGGNEGIKELEVYNFTGAGGVALSMYNTDEVCNCMVFSFCYSSQIIFNCLIWK